MISFELTSTKGIKSNKKKKIISLFALIGIEFVLLFVLLIVLGIFIGADEFTKTMDHFTDYESRYKVATQTTSSDLTTYEKPLEYIGGTGAPKFFVVVGKINYVIGDDNETNLIFQYYDQDDDNRYLKPTIYSSDDSTLDDNDEVVMDFDRVKPSSSRRSRRYSHSGMSYNQSDFYSYDLSYDANESLFKNKYVIFTITSPSGENLIEEYCIYIGDVNEYYKDEELVKALDVDLPVVPDENVYEQTDLVNGIAGIIFTTFFIFDVCYMIFVRVED